MTKIQVVQYLNQTMKVHFWTADYHIQAEKRFHQCADLYKMRVLANIFEKNA